MDKVWWVAISALGIADAFFFHCSKSVLIGKWWAIFPGSGYIGCVLLLKREWTERNSCL